MAFLLRILVLFLIVFNVRMPFFHYSQLYAMLIVTLYYIFSWRKIPFGQFFRSYVVKILVVLALLILVTYSLTIFHLAFDISYVQDYVEQFAFLLSLLYILPFLCEGDVENVFNRVSELVILAFCLQSCIAVAAFFNGSVAKYLLLHQAPTFIDRDIPAFRLYSIGGDFFYLTAGYGLCFILYVRLLFSNYQKNFFSNSVVLYIIPLFLLFGIILNGRTGFVGVAAALVYLFCMKESFISKLLFVLKMIGCAFLIVVIASSMMSKKQLSLIREDVVPFAFEFVINYLEEDKLTTASTEELSENMYYQIPSDVLWQGTGRYMLGDGMYYGGSDAGYMRNILYGGIFYLFLLIYYQLLFFLNPIKTAWQDRHSIGRSDVLFWIIVLAYMFVLHYKGDTIGVSHLFQSVLLLLGCAYLKKQHTNTIEV